MILLYAFSNPWGTNISHRTLSELISLVKGRSAPQRRGERDFAFELIHGSPRPFFTRYIEHKNYSLIIGLGDGPKYIDKIKIETRAKNNYLDKEIYPFSPILLDLNLPIIDNYDSRFFQISSNMGTYNCNYLAYCTQAYLNQKSPQTKHLFLHLPPKSNAKILTTQIHELFSLNHLI